MESVLPWELGIGFILQLLQKYISGLSKKNKPQTKVNTTLNHPYGCLSTSQKYANSGQHRCGKRQSLSFKHTRTSWFAYQGTRSECADHTCACIHAWVLQQQKTPINLDAKEPRKYSVESPTKKWPLGNHEISTFFLKSLPQEFYFLATIHISELCCPMIYLLHNSG